MAEKYMPHFLWTFTISFILITFLPRSVDSTMFMDGVAYASIARNMAEGLGSFWQPYFADSFWLPYDNDVFFYGHPPLQFGIEALLFGIFGDTPLVENLFNVLILTCSILLITGIWCLFFNNKPDIQRHQWLPVLCWYSMLIVWYAIPNHLLDTTMSLFCLLSCFFQLKSQHSDVALKKHAFQVFGGLAIFLAFLTKGPVGLYPLAFTALYLLIFDRASFRKTISPSLVLSATFLVCICLTLFYEPARFFLTKYFNGQVVGALMHEREAAGEDWTAHFYLVVELFRSIKPHLIITGLLFLIFYVFRISTKMSETGKRVAGTCFVVSVSAFLPLLISIKQYHHYLLPATPFFALTFAALLQDKICYILNFNRRLSLSMAVLGIVGCWIMTVRKISSTAPDISVDNALKISKYVPKSATIGICHDLFQRADLHVSLQRYHHLSLTTRTDTTIFVLADSSCMESFRQEDNEKITLEGGYFLVIKTPVSKKFHQPESLSHL